MIDHAPGISGTIGSGWPGAGCSLLQIHKPFCQAVVFLHWQAPIFLCGVCEHICNMPHTGVAFNIMNTRPVPQAEHVAIVGVFCHSFQYICTIKFSDRFQMSWKPGGY